MLSSPLEDENRFRGILDAAIAAGTVVAHKKYTQETERSRKARIERARREARRAEKRRGEIEKEKGAGAEGAKGKGAKGKGSGIDDLAALMQQRQKARAGDFFAGLEAKYAPKKGKKRPSPEDEPPEEAFQRNAVKGKKGKASTAVVDAEEEPTGRSRKSKRVKK